MIGHLFKFKPFNFESGRLHEIFATIKSSPSRYTKYDMMLYLVKYTYKTTLWSNIGNSRMQLSTLNS